MITGIINYLLNSKKKKWGKKKKEKGRNAFDYDANRNLRKLPYKCCTEIFIYQWAQVNSEIFDQLV